jgi:hypothetical protein
MVVRYSQDDDIITLTPGGANNDIIASIEGKSIPGFSGFVDPLDLTEDLRNGNIYISEYGGKGKIDLLRPKENIPGFGSISLNPSGIYDIYVSLGNTGTSRIVTIKNTGSGNLFIGGINISGINANEFTIGGLPAFPILIRAGSSMVFTVTFTPSSAGLRNASINIKSDDASEPGVSVPLTGFGIVQLAVYPNPVHKKFKVALPEDYGKNITMQIVDVAGRIYTIENHTLKKDEFTAEVDISKFSLNRGVYFLKIYSDNGKMQAVKLVVQ